MSVHTTSHPRRALLAAGIGAVGITGLLACAPTPSPGGAEDDGDSEAGGSITVGVEAGSPWETFYRQAAPDFTEQTGIDVEILAVPHANMRQQFLSDAIAGEGAYDVYTVDQPWVPEFAAKGYLLDLDDRISQQDRDDFLPRTLDTVTYDDRLYALPFMVHNLVLYYRTDLFRAAGIDGPPETWEQYRDYARRLADRGAGIWGTIVPGQQNGEVATRFQSFLQQTGGEIVDGEGEPSIDTPAAENVFELMTGIQFEDESSPPGLHGLTEIQGQFLEGNVAMAMVWPYLYGQASDPAQSNIVGDFDVALNPGDPDQVATTFSWGFGISAASQNPDAAWKWVHWASSPPVLERLSREHVTPAPRRSAMEAVAAGDHLSRRDRHALDVFTESMARSETIPMTPAFPQYQEAIAVAVSSVMSQSQDPDEALETAQDAMEAAAGLNP